MVKTKYSQYNSQKQNKTTQEFLVKNLNILSICHIVCVVKMLPNTALFKVCRILCSKTTLSNTGATY